MYAISFLATLNTRRAVRGRGTDHDEKNSSATGPRRATTEREEVETNMFHLGTRMPTLHEADEPYAFGAYTGAGAAAYDLKDLKPGYPPEPARCV